jgi:hypothetical protein
VNKPDFFRRLFFGGSHMKKAYFCIAVTLLLLCLSGCVIAAGAGANTDTPVPSATHEPDAVAPVNLTDREKLFTSVFTNNFTAYDYSTSHSGVYAWLEEYDFGVDKGEALEAKLNDKTGTIILTVINGKKDNAPGLSLFAGNIKSEANAESLSADRTPQLKGLFGITDGIKEKVNVPGDTLIGYASFVKDEKTNPWLSEGFLKDYKSHIGELKNIDVAYLLICRFTDIMENN